MAARLIQGSDYTIALTLTDSNGDAVDIATLEQLNVFVYQKRTNIVQEWSLADSSITIVDASNGKVSVALDRSNTYDTKTSRLFAEVAFATEDTNFEDDLKWTIATDIVIGDVINRAGA